MINILGKFLEKFVSIYHICIIIKELKVKAINNKTIYTSDKPKKKDTKTK
jgi:hypothetical protein